MKTNSKKTMGLIMIGAATLAVFFSACKKDKQDKNGDDSSGTSKNYALVIQNGARNINQGESINYSAYLVDKDGNQISAGSVSWSSSNSSGSFSGSTFMASGSENTTISASVTYEGKTYTASVPLAISIPSQMLFAVVPSAIIYETGGSITLETIYLGTQSSSYSFSSGNSSVASVSSTGVVSFTGVGSTEITVNATIGGQTSVIKVPVLVVGTPQVTLPVTKIVVTPGSGEIFRGETKQYSAKAYDASGADVTSSVSFNWYAEKKDADQAMPVSINSSGVLTGTDIGEAYVFATAKGIIGQAEVIVNPDTVLMIEPFFVSLGGIDPWTGTMGPDEQTFNAKLYKVNRSNYYASSLNYLDLISNPGTINFFVPLTGIPAADDLLDIVTLSNATSSSVKASMKAGKFGSTILIAELQGKQGTIGAAMINVGF